MGAYVAIINTPGYMPWSEDNAAFNTAREAWEYLREEIERMELAYEPVDLNDPEGPQSLTDAALDIEQRTMSDRTHEIGTVYGPSYIPESPDEDTSTDLGYAYSVQWSEDEEVEEY